VVIDHIEDDGQAEGMRPVHEAAEIVRRAVEARRREQVHAVIAPAEAAGEFRDRHQFEHRDAQFGQPGKFAHRRLPRPFGREGADVHFVDDLPFDGTPFPSIVGPAEA
jgi:hypothetical protein